MLRRFNYTGRKKILHEHVPISLTGSKPLWGFDIDLSHVGSYELPSTARIYVEAYEQAAYMRFDFGTIGSVAPPPKESRVLSEFEGSDSVRFRVKVVDHSAEAKLLAEADGILPLAPEETEQNRLPLLPVRHYDLGQELWKIGFEEGTENRPTLLVNNFIEDRTAFVRSPAFTSLAWPAILREILVRILVIEDYRELDDRNDWRCLWLQFARTFIPGRALPPEREESFEWIADAVTAFSEKNGLLAKYKEHEEEEANG
jgi:hypothetical protein